MQATPVGGCQRDRVGPTLAVLLLDVRVNGLVDVRGTGFAHCRGQRRCGVGTHQHAVAAAVQRADVQVNGLLGGGGGVARVVKP